MSMLPRHTKVVVTRNKRTESAIVGLQGVVKKAMVLGGWHWLVLTNGLEVKLQMNAFRVIEAPTRNKDDDDSVIENGSQDKLDLDCDLKMASIQNKKRPLQRINGSEFMFSSRRLGHKSPSSSHKPMTTPFSSVSQSKDSVSTPYRGSMKIDLSKLEMATLLRYCHHFNLNNDNPHPSREELVEVVQRHFMTLELDEMQVIATFVQAAKRLKTLHK